MSLDSKITVNFFINESLKAKSIVSNGKKVKAYPLYIMVIFASQNTKFKALIDGNTVYMSRDQDPMTDPIIGKKISKKIDKISRIIGAEVKIRQDRFSLTGLGRRIQVYEILLAKIIGQITISNIYKHPSINTGFDLKATLEYYLPKYEGVNVFDWLYNRNAVIRRKGPIPNDALNADIDGFESLVEDKINGMLFG